jgi:HAD superfamily phosphoserine phosphatase-like hydrolase
MDSTIITSESLDDLAALAGLADAVTAITKRAMAGEIDFESALFECVSMLAGRSSRLSDQLIATTTPTSGAIELVHTMRTNRAKCYLVSGGFDVITYPVAALCGFHDHRANHLHVCDNKILGASQTPVLDSNAKATYFSIIANRMVLIRLMRQPLAMRQMIWRCCKPPAWVWPLRASHCFWPKWQSSLTILILAACCIFKDIKSVMSSQIKFRDSIYPVQIKGAKTGPFVFDIKKCHLPFRIEGTAYFLAKLI